MIYPYNIKLSYKILVVFNDSIKITKHTNYIEILKFMDNNLIIEYHLIIISDIQLKLYRLFVMFYLL